MEAAPPTPNTTPTPAPEKRTLSFYWRWATGQAAQGQPFPPLLIPILAIALALRLYGIGWDGGNFFHPDERSIYMRVDCMYRVLTTAPNYADCIRDHPFTQTQPGFPSPTELLDANRSPLNPHWFPLGTLIIYALLGIKLLLAPFLTMDLQDLAVAGRSLSAFADVGTVAMAYALGTRIYGRGAGLLAAALIAFAVVHIQVAHFYRPEPFQNLFTLAAFWKILDVVQRQRVRDSAMLGLFVGLTFAMKASSLPLLLPVAAGYVYLWVRLPKVGAQGLAPLQSASLLLGSEPPPTLALPRKGGGEHGQAMEAVAFRALLAGVVAAAVYAVTTPYALLGFPEFLEWNLRELDIVRRAGIVPYTLQYMGAPKLVYEVQQSVAWGLGVPLGVLAWGGFLVTLALTLRRPRLPQALLLLWAVPLFFTVAGVQVKFLRYTFPLMPVFIIMGTGIAMQLVGWARQRHKQAGTALAVLLGVIVAATAFYGLAFAAIYSRPHPAVQASQWLNANVRPATEILTDNHWDEGIPDVGRFEVTQLPMFDGDSFAKMESVSRTLARGEYLVFYSNRTYGAIARAPDRYPYSSAYYHALFRGDLGYELAAGFSRYPSLLGVAFIDDPFTRAGIPTPAGLGRQKTLLTLRLGYADNDAITYDHPLVLVFRNTGGLTAEQITERILKAQPASSAEAKPALMLTPEEAATQQRGGTWSRIFDPASIANRLPVVAWLLLVELAFLVTWPIAFAVFRGLHDRGFLLTKALALLLLAYIPWALAAVNVLPYERYTIYLALLGLAAISAAVLFRKREEAAAFLRSHWKGLLLQEALFLAAFLAFVAVRWANPDLWHPYRGGEKPMDFAYLNAVVRSTTVPPYDPWFAGGYLNYYYFGQFIVATLVKATGILPEVAYNLAVPLMFALTVGGAFSVAFNLAHALGRHRDSDAGPAWQPAAAGIGAALFVAVLGNMGSAVQLAVNAWKVSTAGSSFPAFDFWAPSRMMPGQISITEFPFWTFLFADLHAHLIAIPFGLLCIGLALNVVGTRTHGHTDIHAEGQQGEEGGGQSIKKEGWLRSWGMGELALPVTFLALAVGAMAPINTWDYPSYLLLGLAAIFLASYAEDLRINKSVLLRALAWGLAFALLSYALFLPYHIRNSAFGAGIHGSQWQTDIRHYLAIHALFLWVIAAYLLWQLWRIFGSAARRLRQLAFQPQSIVADASAAAGLSRLSIAPAILLPLVLLYALATGYGTIAFLFALAAVAVILAMRLLAGGSAGSPHQVFLLMLPLGALAIGMGVDMVTLDNDIDRMNTVFKLYLEAWVLFGVASAVMGAQLIGHRAGTVWAKAAKGLWLAVLALVVVAAAIFPALGTRARLADRFATDIQGLNGAQFMETATYYDANGPIELRYDWDAIQWLRANVQGSPVIAEGSTDPHNYRWGGRVSIYTGLPAIVGWGWHQTQQRMEDEPEVRRRLIEVRALYTTTDLAFAEDILKEYGVRYVYVGRLERLYYPAEGLAKFERMPGLRLVYENPEARVYEVGEVS
ncbi:MAG: glycosyltransferase family 39 protein [Chloroflexi bacterium]|nr:glycosyltransferase family 39 protein [Chloroflexota bacterium]